LSTNKGSQFYVKQSLNMLPTPGAAPPNSNISDISGNYEQISTKFLAICLQTRVMSITRKSFEISYPLLGQPHPYFKTLNISGK